MKKSINFKVVLRQLKADLIGKDSYRGVTLTYSWLANQFGHFSLGYVPTLVVYSLLKRTKFESPAFWAAFIISCLWLLFEAYNFLGPLLLKRHSKSNLLFVPDEKYIFQPAWGNVAFDTFTDLCFFWYGSFWASLFLHSSSVVSYILIADTLILVYPVSYWFLTKMYLQYARFPIQFRLSQWTRMNEDPLPETDVKTVLTFIETYGKSTGNHLLILGGRRSGKSTLAIGIGTELSIRRCPSSYYTGMKWFNLLSLNDADTLKAENCDVWSWRTSSFLIIDDINPGNPISTIFMSPQNIFAIINTPVNGNPNTNKEDLKNKNVIWVLGDEASNNPEGWQKMLVEIGIHESKIKSIGLGFIFM